MLAPLKFKVPSAPRSFVGRTREDRALSRLLDQENVVLVVGAAGLGKTSLLARVLARKSHEQAVYVLARAGDSVDAILSDILQATTPQDGTAVVISHHDALVAAALGAAERTGRWVVVDDAHHLDPTDLDPLVEAFARYASRSRLCLVGRSAISRAAAIAVGPMPEADLELLAKRLAPSLTAAERAAVAAASHGSPWALRRCLDAVSLGLPPSPELALPADVQAQALLALLTSVREPLPRAVLLGLVPSSQPSLARLVAQGIVLADGETAASPVRLHEIARSLLRMPPPDPSEAQRIATVLAQGSDPQLTLEAIRLFSISSQDRMVALLLDRAPVLLEAGFAVRLWPWLTDVSPSSSLAEYRERCAIEIGDPAILSRLLRPVSPSPARRLVWARVLAGRGELRPAADEARGAGLAAEDPSFAFEAGYQAVQYLVSASGNQAALDAARGLVPPNEADRARRDLAVALILNRLEDPAAMKLGEDAFVRFLGVESTAVEPRVYLGGVFWWACLLYEQSDYERANGVIDAALERTRATDTLLQHTAPGRAIIYLRACIALMLGELDTARRHAACIGRAMARGARWRAESNILLLSTRLLAGEGRGLLGDIDDALHEVEGAVTPNPNHILPLRALRVRYAMYAGRPAPDFAVASGWIGEILAVVAARSRLRMGTGARCPAVQSGEEPLILSRAFAMDEALLEGELERAIALGREVVSRFEETRNWGCVAEALTWLADALILGGRTAEVEEAARRLAEIAARLPSPRFLVEAELLRSMTGGPRQGFLAALHAEDVSLLAHRRARAWLGASADLDAIDRRVLGALGARVTAVPTQARPESSIHAAWLLEPAHQHVHLRTRTVDLTRSPIAWALLATLIRGPATKEELVRSIWAVEYHPLRHDNRLQVAVRELRELVEDMPAEPARIVTTQDGYALAQAFRLDPAGDHDG